MRCHTPNASGAVLREARRRHGLSQRRLALRAGTSQDAISRVERGAESPTFERFRQLLAAMGERAQLGVAAVEVPIDREQLAAAKALSPRERLLESASWNLVATRLEIAGAEARLAAHPGTRRASGKR